MRLRLSHPTVLIDERAVQSEPVTLGSDGFRTAVELGAEVSGRHLRQQQGGRRDHEDQRHRREQSREDVSKQLGAHVGCFGLCGSSG